MSMTEKDITSNITSNMVKTNLNHLNVIIGRAERANKGCFCHDINKWLSELKTLCEKMNKVSPEDVDRKDLVHACKLSTGITHRLYLLDCYKGRNGYIPEMLIDCEGQTLMGKALEKK